MGNQFQSNNPQERHGPTPLDQELERRRILEASPIATKLDPAEDRQRRLATYLSKMSNQALAMMLALENKEIVKHEAEEVRQELSLILGYLQKPTKDKIITDEIVEEWQQKLNKIGEKYGILEDYSKN